MVKTAYDCAMLYSIVAFGGTFVFDKWQSLHHQFSGWKSSHLETTVPKVFGLYLRDGCFNVGSFFYPAIFCASSIFGTAVQP